MLRNSFIILDGIGRQREVSLWRKGVLTWEDFLKVAEVRGVSEKRKALMDEDLRGACKKLASADSRFFASSIPSREHWRCLGDFLEGAVFLDIETTGLSLRSPVTVVGVHDGKRTTAMIRGMGLTRSNLHSALASAKIIVTYNGSGFDLPVLESQFPGVIPPIPHVDLRYPLRRLGYSGGLKAIERELDIERDQRVEYMTGEDAAYLWRLWERHGKKNALDLLVEYNAADCANLVSLARFSYKGLRRCTFEAHTHGRNH